MTKTTDYYFYHNWASLFQPHWVMNHVVTPTNMICCTFKIQYQNIAHSTSWKSALKPENVVLLQTNVCKACLWPIFLIYTCWDTELELRGRLYFKKSERDGGRAKLREWGMHINKATLKALCIHLLHQSNGLQQCLDHEKPL